MSNLDTLKIYQEYIAAGFTEEKAVAMTNVLENSFITKVNELRREFTSNKMVAIMGTIIIAIGGFTLNKLWDLSHDMTEVKSRLTSLEDRIK